MPYASMDLLALLILKRNNTTQFYSLILGMDPWLQTGFSLLDRKVALLMTSVIEYDE
jgi:hypothetical protein